MHLSGLKDGHWNWRGIRDTEVREDIGYSEESDVKARGVTESIDSSIEKQQLLLPQ